MKDLRKNEGLAQDIYTALTSDGLTMFIAKNYFGDGVAYQAVVNPVTNNSVTVHKLDRNTTTHDFRSVGSLGEFDPATIEAALDDMDGVPELTRLSADIFVALMTGTMYKQFDYSKCPILMIVEPGSSKVFLKVLNDEDTTASVTVERTADQPKILKALEELLADY